MAPTPGVARPPQQATASTVSALMDTVCQAKAKLQPAHVGFGTGFSYLNVARDSVNEETHLWTQAANLDVPSDKTVAVVKFTTPSGEPIAAYVNCAMHPVNGYLVGITSADFPGAACQYVEQAFDDKMVMVFTQGASNALASKSGVKITGYELVRESVEGPLREGNVPHGKLDPKIADNFEQRDRQRRRAARRGSHSRDDEHAENVRRRFHLGGAKTADLPGAATHQYRPGRSARNLSGR
jgi:hypothetical protein